MKLIDLAKEVAALGGYGITGSDTQSVTNKARSIRRINQIRSDIASRFCGRWQGSYREGWLALVPIYNTGYAKVTQGSRTVEGVSTAWTSSMVGSLFLGPSCEYYKIVAVSAVDSLTLSEPYQGVTDVTGTAAYHIWTNEYQLYAEVFSVQDFLNYSDPQQMAEDFTKHDRNLNPRSTAVEIPRVYTVIGRKANGSTYSTGTVSGTIDTKTLSGSGTAWLANLAPGTEIVIGSYTYHVDSIESDTSLTLKEALVATVAAGTSYKSTPKNRVVIRFSHPSAQQVVNYAYYSKVYPLVNDNDEDWICELYPHVILDGVMKYDFLDKNDPTRAQQAALMYENSIKNAHISDSSQYGGVTVVGLDIPDSARE